MLRLFRGAIAAALLVLATLPARALDQTTVTVFAAASLTDALGKIGQAYEAAGNGHVVFNFAASSLLARQIGSSAGTDMFISADTDWMDYLDNRGLIAHATRVNLLGNHLALIAPADSNVTVTIAPHFDLAGALGGGRLALADPDSVPAGKYARAALTSLGVWDGVSGHLAPAENVRAALAYVARGEAPLGIVYTTDAMAEPKVRIVGTFPANTPRRSSIPPRSPRTPSPQPKNFLPISTRLKRGRYSKRRDSLFGYRTPLTGRVALRGQVSVWSYLPLRGEVASANARAGGGRFGSPPPDPPSLRFGGSTSPRRGGKLQREPESYLLAGARMTKWIGRIGMGLALLIGVVVILFTAFFLSFELSVPDYDGKVAVAGLSAPARIVRDQYAIPHIAAASFQDAVFALGYAHAQDRLWQMEVSRRAIAGRLSGCSARQRFPSM